MAVVSRITTLVLSGSTGSRTWTVTATAQDTAAGASVTLNGTVAASGATPPTAESSLICDIFVDNGQTLVRSIPFVVNQGNVATLYMTSDGTISGALRAGTLRIRIRAIQSFGLSATQYDVNSDNGAYGSPASTVPTGFTVTRADQGYIRGTTTAVVTLNQASYAYGDTITETVTLGAVPYESRTLASALGPLTAVTSGASTSAVFTVDQGVCDNRFPASSNTDTTVTTVPNAALVATPWTVLTTTEASTTVDPRLTFNHQMQLNIKDYATPPTANAASSNQRLTSDIGFLTSRVVNAAGAGVNGITWTRTLQDADALTTAQTQTGIVSATEGGEAGWANTPMPWTAVLPGGIWDKTVVITAPTDATGLEVTPTTTYQLISSNPNYRILCAGGPATSATDARHFTPGVPFLAGMAVFNTQTKTTLELDASPVPSIALGRFNLTYGRAEFLDSDGVWKATNGVTTYYWPCTQSPGDTHAWTVSFVDTTTWGVSDVFVVGRCYIGGVPVTGFSKEIAVNGLNNHDAYKFDGPGFVGFPTR